MSETLRLASLSGLHWLEIDVVLLAHTPPNRSHPLVVLEALFKGVFEAAQLNPKTTKQLWQWPGMSVDDMHWHANTPIHLTLQLFGAEVSSLGAWIDQLHARFSAAHQPHFTLTEVGVWRVGRLPSEAMSPDDDGPALGNCLDFLTPVPLPHVAGTPATALDDAGFIRLCQTRLRKLFGCEADLPPAPTREAAWRYWRRQHQSHSQSGHAMFLNGCVGPLYLMGEHLAEWQPWLRLLACVGLGERLSFGQGRFVLRHIAQAATQAPAPAPVSPRLKRTFVLDVAYVGAKLSLDDDNLVVEHAEHATDMRWPLMRLDGLELYAPCQVSTPLLQSCAHAGIPVVLATPGQAPLVVVGEQAEVQRLRSIAAHHQAWQALDEAQHARVAAQFVVAKLQACAWLIRQRYQAGDNVVLKQLDRAKVGALHSERLSVVRGWEGWAARHYQQWLQRDMSPLGPFERRLLRGQTQDPINLLLNYSYALLRHRLAVAVRLAGLDPYLGHLHEANGRHDALVSDWIELWRAYVDRQVLRWINLKVIQTDGFVMKDGVLRLLPRVRSRMVQDMTELLERTPKSGGSKLITLIRQSIASYAAATSNGGLQHWQLDTSALDADATTPSPTEGDDE